MKYYVDTAIWRDLWENRKDTDKDLGKLASAFFNKIGAKGGKVVYSNLIVEELSKTYKIHKIFKLFNRESKSLIKVYANKSQINQAIILSKEFNIPPPDGLHCLLARDNNAMVITRDRHFKKLSGFVLVRKPEDLI